MSNLNIATGDGGTILIGYLGKLGLVFDVISSFRSSHNDEITSNTSPKESILEENPEGLEIVSRF